MQIVCFVVFSRLLCLMTTKKLNFLVPAFTCQNVSPVLTVTKLETFL